MPEDKVALKQRQKRIRQLEKELAEAAAILVLRKKFRDYYGETDGNGIYLASESTFYRILRHRGEVHYRGRRPRLSG